MDFDGVLDDAEDQSVVAAFDLFGTLLSVESISAKLAETFPDKADAIAALWRRYQLEYTWRMNSMGTYEPFDAITKKSLQHALKEFSLTLPSSKLNALLAAYDHLSAYPDVTSTITKLSKDRHVRPLIFTNGTAAMATASMANSKEVGLFSGIPENLVSVDDIQKYKPHPMTYEYLAAKVGKGVAGVGEIVLISANPFDVVGASEVGLKAVWLDRSGKGWQDGLGSPTFTIKSLEEVPAIIEQVWKGYWGEEPTSAGSQAA